VNLRLRLTNVSAWRGHRSASSIDSNEQPPAERRNRTCPGGGAAMKDRARKQAEPRHPRGLLGRVLIRRHRSTSCDTCSAAAPFAGSCAGNVSFRPSDRENAAASDAATDASGHAAKKLPSLEKLDPTAAS